MNKPKFFYLPPWFPCASSWLKSLIMGTLIIILVTLVNNFNLGIYFWQKLGGNLELLICLSIIILFSFIVFFAFAHHFLLMFFYVIRQIIQKILPRGLFFFPGIISWWKALYTWLVIMISSLATILIYTLTLPWFNLNYKTAILAKSQWLYPETFPEKFILFVSIIIWLIVAAKLYQFEILSNNYFRLNQTNNNFPYIKSPPNFRKSVETLKNPKKAKKSGINLQNPDHKLANYQIYNGVNKPRSSHKAKNKHQKRKSTGTNNNSLNQLLKPLKNNILVLLIIPLLGLGVYGFYQWQLTSKTPVFVVNEIPSPTPQTVNSENSQLAQEKSIPVPQSSPIETSSSTPKTTIVLPPPDPFKLAVNRAMRTAKIAQSAKSKVEWEAVASQWQDATELMKIVPPSHPKYKQARQKIKEYQSYADYATRVAESK
ncbi:MAG: hypothetical protein AB4080_03165 [Trichodesmium sp.]